MQAQNRKLEDWYWKIKRSEIKLPRFQRFEAWDKHRISSLLEVVVRNLPLGITLVLEVGDNEKFISRYLETSPEHKGRVYEHLLDGQQRLTALWRALHNNYENETYFIYLEEFDNYEADDDREDLSAFCKTRYYRKNGLRYPLWCDNPAECLERGMIPTHLLQPGDIHQDINAWVDEATKSKKPEDKDELEKFYETKGRIRSRIQDMRSIIANYNLPYLSLPSHTDKTVALNVFINMNTNSKPLSQYDIIVAEVESIMEQSLHDLEEGLDMQYPKISRYSPLSDQILTTSALIQGQLPNQRGAWDMDKIQMVKNWEIMARGLNRMVNFLNREGIYDRERLPTNAVLAVIAALYTFIPESGDKMGKDELLLKKYLWHSFFTDRYENSAATHAFADFKGLKAVICEDKKQDGSLYEIRDIPIFSDHKIAEIDELISSEWPKRVTIRGRAILAVACRLGAFDFATGETINESNIENRHYHHIYPDALLKEAGINGSIALNCALITDKTNITIGRKDPLKYLKDRYEWTSEEIVSERLQSHLIPIQQLANGGYEGLSDTDKNQKLAADFDAFIRKRAEYIHKAAKNLAEGRQLSLREKYGE
ncbi:hypothetical protein J2T58_001333 [Methanocalculus alkaliphilus]|nr:DUF262 domain-containing protein [Methanocalculus alkaliphilus]MCP1715468.1 hypothetical protein [Methanocalculus alkaliphilus]